MNLDFTEEQQALRGTLRDFFEKESPPRAVRAAEPLGFDAALWRKVCELGLPFAAVPEELGGGGAGWVELAIAAEALGQYLAPVPLIEVAVASGLLASLAGVSPGERVATLALSPAAGGVARLVPAGAIADLVLVLRGEELLVVEKSGRPAAAVPNLGAMPLADCAVPEGAVVLARGEEAVAAWSRGVRQWRLLTAAALAGLAAKALDIGLGYVLQRRAFGVLIGSFQTVQHRLADHATSVDGARLLAYKAAWAFDSWLPSAGFLAEAAFLFAAETAFATASDSLHFHGGYGYTLEYDIQLYFRRAKAWPLVAGDRRAGYAALARSRYGDGASSGAA